MSTADYFRGEAFHARCLLAIANGSVFLQFADVVTVLS
jgi:hypothetical protein